MDGNNYYASPSAQSPGATYSSPHYVSPSSYTPGGAPTSPNATSNPFQSSSYQQQIQESLTPVANQQSTSNIAKREKTVAVVYICGHCAVLNTIKQGDAIRCKNCGYRIMYKQRTTRKIQFEAR